MASNSGGEGVHIVGPLLIANVITWGLWGVLSTQLYLFILSSSISRPGQLGRDSVSHRHAAKFPPLSGLIFKGAALGTGAGSGTGIGRRRFRGRIGPKNDDDVNPWTVSFTAPTPTSAHPHNAGANDSFSNTSFDAYYAASPSTAVEDSAGHAERFPPHLRGRLRRDDPALGSTVVPVTNTGVSANASAVVGSGTGGDIGISQYPIQRTKSNSNSNLRRKLSANALFASSASTTDSDPWRTKQRLPGRLIRYAAYLLYTLVFTQAILATASVWRLAVVGWSLPGPPSGQTPWEGVVAGDILGPIIFVISMLFFAHRLLVSPPFPAPSQTRTSDSLKRQPSLRPFSLLVQTKEPSQNNYNSNYTAHVHGIDTPFGQNADQQYNSGSASTSRRGTGQGRPKENCNAYSYGPNDGHIQPVPTRWTRFQRCVATSVGQRVSNLMGLARSRWALPWLLSLVAFVVGICGLVHGGKLLNKPPQIGSPRDLDGPLSTWLVGTVVVNLLVCMLLFTSLIASRALTSQNAHAIPWLGRAVRVLGEAGVAQLIVSVVALVLVCAWRGGKPFSTLPIAPSLVLPALYANTVLLNVSQSYTSTAIFFAPSSTASSRVDVKGGLPVEGKEDIEMGIRGISHSNPAAAQHISFSNLFGTGTMTGTNSSSDTTAVRAAALAYGAEQRERDEATGANANAKSLGTKQHVPTISPTGAPMILERDTVGESSAGKAKTASGLADAGATDDPAGVSGRAIDQRTGITATGSGSGVPTVVNDGAAARRMSGISGALSLELPVFRKRRGYDIDGLWEPEDDDDTDSYVSSFDEDGGTWDYGYALNMTMLVREKERDERERATAAAHVTNDSEAPMNAGANRGSAVRWKSQRRSQRNSYPAFPGNRRRGARSPAQDDLADMDGDTVSILSSSTRRSSRSRSRRSHQFHQYAQYPHQHQYPFNHIPSSGMGRPPRRLPPTPDDTSVMIISGPMREPSIVEPSVYRAASVAATRASTGSMWSSYTYPKPMAFPDLDDDLQDPPPGPSGFEGPLTEVTNGDGFQYDPDPAGAGCAALGQADTVEEQDPGDGLGTHPYAAAATAAAHKEDEERRLREHESRKRRWDVHPLKRMVEMGRLKR